MFTCISCNSSHPIRRNTTSKYCSNSCQQEYEYRQRVDSWLSGKEVGYMGKTKNIKNFVRRWLFETRGCKCEECGWDKLHPVDNRPLVEIDHIDGDAGNCSPSNLKILCPNCHSQTPTFRARNKVSTRIR